MVVMNYLILNFPSINYKYVYCSQYYQMMNAKNLINREKP